jgi:hypothetical protein
MRTLLAFLFLVSNATFAAPQSTCYPKKRGSFFNAIVPLEFLPDSTAALIRQRIQAVYAQDAAAAGGPLNVRESSEMDFGAFAYRDGGELIVDLNKGMRFHKLIDSDSYALVACHEVGHHLGGLPVFVSSPVSVEGQADYFSSLKCMRRYLENLPPAELDFGPAPDLRLVQACSEKMGVGGTALKICARTLAAAKVLGAILAELWPNSMARPCRFLKLRINRRSAKRLKATRMRNAASIR